MTINHWCSSRSMRFIKISHLIIMALHYYQRNGNPCNLRMVRMRIVLQNSNDSGTMSLLKIFLQFDRGWPRLSAAARSSLPSITAVPTQLAITLPAPTTPCYFYIIKCLYISIASWASRCPSCRCCSCVLTYASRRKSLASIFKVDRSRPC